MSDRIELYGMDEVVEPDDSQFMHICPNCGSDDTLARWATNSEGVYYQYWDCRCCSWAYISRDWFGRMIHGVIGL